MRRGEVWWVDFDPAVGSEIKKLRPAVIVSNDSSNATQSRLQVVPCTTAPARGFPWEVSVMLNGRVSKACADQIKTVSKQRFKGRMCLLTVHELSLVEDAILYQLAL